MGGYKIDFLYFIVHDQTDEMKYLSPLRRAVEPEAEIFTFVDSPDLVWSVEPSLSDKLALSRELENLDGKYLCSEQ